MVQLREFFDDSFAGKKVHAFFEYNYDKEVYIFYYNKKQIKIEKNKINQYIFEIQDVIEEDKNLLLDFFLMKLDGELDYRIYDKSKNIRYYKASSMFIKDEDGRSVHWIGCTYNVEQNSENFFKQRENKKHKLSLDSLTKLYNKDSIKLMITKYLAEHGTSYNNALIIIDIDNFKSINENLGRLFGDAVLQNVGDQLKKHFYGNSYIGRIGGDEYLIFMKDIHSHEEFENAAKVISRIFRDTYIGENPDNVISCSIGGAISPLNGSTYEELFDNADRALHMVKKQGKNDYILYNYDRDDTYIKDTGNRNFYHVNETDSFYYTDVDKYIVNFAHDILASTKDTNSGIYMLLDQLGKYFEACAVAILEVGDCSNVLDLTYLWNYDNIKTNDKKLTNIRERRFVYEKQMFNNKGILLLNYSDIMADEELKNHEIIKSNGVKSLLGSALYDEGIFAGSICVSCFNEKKEWTKEEGETLASIANILSGYLFKLRASQKFNERLEQLRNFDELTGLSSFHKFKLDVEEYIYQYPNNNYAIICSDISNFRYINDVLSYKKGDKILCDYADALMGFIGNGETVSRTTADKFMSLLICEDVESLIKRVEDFNAEFSRQQREKEYKANIIIIAGASIVEGGKDVMAAIDNANIARKSIKNKSKTICKFYEKRMSEKINREIEIANSMEYALENNEFTIFLQPKVNVIDNELVGAEALVRWIKPDGKVITPDEFIPQFESNGFIINVDFYVYELTCKTIRQWIDEGLKVFPISVNVSRVHLKDDDFVEDFDQLVKKYDIPPNLIELELTETIFLDQTERALSALKEFRKLGYSVSIDDFGAGYSSLNLLKDMQTDVLKIDREFFRQGELLQEEKIIVSTIINMAKQLNMKVLSEGIETEKQSEFLKEISCDMAQGYFYSKPMPIEQFKNLIIKLNHNE